MPVQLLQLARDRRLLFFVFAVRLFHCANAAMLPQIGQHLAQGKQAARLYMAACIIVAQLVMTINFGDPGARRNRGGYLRRRRGPGQRTSRKRRGFNVTQAPSRPRKESVFHRAIGRRLRRRRLQRRLPGARRGSVSWTFGLLFPGSRVLE